MSRPCGARSHWGRKCGSGWRWLVTEVAEGSFAGWWSSTGLIPLASADVPRDPGPSIGLSPHSALDTRVFFLGPSGSDLPAREHGETSGAAPSASKICELKSGCRLCWRLRSRVTVGAADRGAPTSPRLCPLSSSFPLLLLQLPLCRWRPSPLTFLRHRALEGENPESSASTWCSWLQLLVSAVGPRPELRALGRHVV